MVDFAREAFSSNNFGLAADIYEKTICESGPTSELFLGLADSFTLGGQFSKAFSAYTNAYRYGRVTHEKLKHLVVRLIDTVKQNFSKSEAHKVTKSCLFTCGVCLGILMDPVTIPCGHTFCRSCIEKDTAKTDCELCDTVHNALKIQSLSSNVVMTNLVQKLFPSVCKIAALRNEGNGYIVKGDFKTAIKVYCRAIEIAPQNHLMHSDRCFAYTSLNMFSEAVEDAECVVKLRPDWPKSYFMKGAALYGLCHYEDAAVAFLQCLALDEKVFSANDYLSKTLDKILSALSCGDPKSQALQQQTNPSLLHQLIESNFSQPLLPADLSQIVKERIHTRSNFSQEPLPRVSSPRPLEEAESQPDQVKDIEAADGIFSQNMRCNSLPDFRSVHHEEIYRVTCPSTHSPQPLSRKRLRKPSHSQSDPLSPTHSYPHKLLKSTDTTDAGNLSREPNATASSVQSTCTSAEKQHVKPADLTVDDFECGLCYRLFYEPVTTPCGHTFCRKCLDRCLDHTVYCPMCKGNLSEYLAERRQAVTETVQCIIDTHFKYERTERSIANDEEMVELATMGSGQQCDIPVFVCTLSFPTIPCPLHIFEPRYRLMVRQCMESGARQFGMCMPINNSDNDFSEYGCMLRIRDVQYFPDGRSVLDTIGGQRFKVLTPGKRDGYNTAKVEFISDKSLNHAELQDVLALQTDLHAQVSDWLKKLPIEHRERIARHFGELPALEQIPSGSHIGPVWAWWAVKVLPFGPRAQLQLLAMSGYKERLEAIKKVLAYLNRRGIR